MTYESVVSGGVLILALGFSGCGGSDSAVTPLTPSPLPPQVFVPAPQFPPGSLRGVSLSGVVYELTPAGRRPILGGMGEVYRAHDDTLGRDVAIKVLSTAFTPDAERRARFEREARLLATLNHPHIGAIYGVEDADDVRGLVLELVEGDTLAERLAGPGSPGRQTALG